MATDEIDYDAVVAALLMSRMGGYYPHPGLHEFHSRLYGCEPIAVDYDARGWCLSRLSEMDAGLGFGFVPRAIAAARQAKESAAALIEQGWEGGGASYDLGTYHGDRGALAERLGYEPTHEQCLDLERQIRAALAV